jgi:ubiquinone biosynthesis protein
LKPEESSIKIRIPTVDAVTRSYRQTRRLGDVLAILARNGFDDVVDLLRPERGRTRRDPDARQREGEPTRLTRAQRIRMVIEELGPTFVKLGQVLSSRSDLVPPDLLAELVKLQDRVPPFPFEQVREIIAEELGRPLEDVFEAFDAEPLASASLGQVHRARFGGREVVVKVQRPLIHEKIESDIQLMMQLASLLERRVEGWDIHEPTRAVKEFADTIAEELDYEVEAAHQERFATQFADDRTVHVPSVFRDATSARVLTMEFVHGVKVSDVASLRAEGADLGVVARRGLRLVIEQTLVHGFFHADPHPGNLLVMPGNVICFIDFGMMGRLSRPVRDDFIELIYHVVDRNPQRVAETTLRLTGGEGPASADLERDAARFLDTYLGRSMREMDLGDLLWEVLDTLARHRLRVPSDLYLMLKAIAQMEAVAVALVPDFDLVEEAAPQVRRIFLDRFRPQRVAKEAALVGREVAMLLRDAPAVLREVARVIRRGGIRVGLEEEQMPKVLLTGERIANRIAFAFVLGSSVVGSAIIAAARIPPTWHEISLLGLGGFLVALAMSGWLLVSILRHGKM